jgi:hypothetical protein
MTPRGSIIGLGGLLSLATLAAADVDLAQVEAGLGLLEEKVVLEKPVLPVIVVEAGAEEVAARLKSAEDEGSVNLELDVKEALQEFTAKAAVLRRRQLEPEVERGLEELAESLKLDAATMEKLKLAVPAALDAGMKDWSLKFRQWLSPYLADSGDALGMLGQWKPEQLVAANRGAVQAERPFQTVVWKGALKEHLTPEQLQLVEAMEQKEREKMLADLKTVLDSSEDAAKEVFSQAMETELDEILNCVALDEERIKQLRKGAEEAVALTTKDWRRRINAKAMAMEPSAREQFQSEGQGFGVDPKETENRPQGREPWLAARKKLLTEAEEQAVKEGLKSMKQSRIDALAMIVIAEVDGSVGFRTQQREQLLALARPLFSELPDHWFAPAAAEGRGFQSIDMAELANKLREILDSDLAAVLDAGQIKRWHHLNPEKMKGRRVVRRKSSPVEAPAAEPDDPHWAERLIGLTLVRQGDVLREEYFSRMVAKVDNISRVASLAPEVTSRLLTAAKGSAERMARGAIVNLDQSVHQQLHGVKPADLPARLKSLSLESGQGRVEQPLPELWKTAVEQALTAPQQEAWKAECDAAEDWQVRSISAVVSTGITRTVRLKADKEALLREKIGEKVRTYGPEINNYLSQGWFLSGYYDTVPVAMLSDAEMAAVFTAKEIEAVRTRCLSRSQQYAEIIKQQHQSRVRNSRKAN